MKLPVEKRAAVKKEKLPPKTAKSEQRDYETAFLVRKQSLDRKQTYIDRKLYLLIQEMLHTIAPHMSIAGYINNVLNEHLDEYWEIIDRMYKAAPVKSLSRE